MTLQSCSEPRVIVSTVCSLLFSYYSLEDISHESINRYLSNLVERSLRDLEGSYCIEIKEVCDVFKHVLCMVSQMCSKVSLHRLLRTISRRSLLPTVALPPITT